MKLIVWLWNPGKEYELTRHNLGFLFLDFLKNEERFEDFKFESKFKGEISSWKIGIDKVILLKPQTYMNLSWESIREVMSYYKIDIEDLVVIYDDISMEFWKIRFRNKGSAGWHNWIKNIIKFYWDTFDRVKVGVDLHPKYEVSDWVLSKFKKEELDSLPEVFEKASEILKENL